MTIYQCLKGSFMSPGDPMTQECHYGDHPSHSVSPDQGFNGMPGEHVTHQGRYVSRGLSNLPNLSNDTVLLTSALESVNAGGFPDGFEHCTG